MFGDRKELILPLVLDIANLVKLAAESNHAGARSKGQSLAVHDQYDPLPAAVHDDRLSVDMDDEVVVRDTKEENHSEQRAFIVTRSAPFYDHLLKMVPKPMAPKKQPVLQRRVDSGQPPKPPTTLPLNQKPFLVPSTVEARVPTSVTPPTMQMSSKNHSGAYNEVEDLALQNLNGTHWTDSEPSATELDEEDEDAADDETLPTAEKLIGGRYRKKPYSRYSQRKPGSSLAAASLCEKFTGSVCLRVEDYPMCV